MSTEQVSNAGSNQKTILAAKGLTFTTSKGTGLTSAYASHVRSESFIRFNRCRNDPKRREPFFHKSRRLVELMNCHVAWASLEIMRQSADKLIEVEFLEL